VEAVNKVVKYRYLFPKKLPDGASLDKAVSEAIVDYNDLRPHCVLAKRDGSLSGLTPSEAYQGIDKETMRTHEKLKTAQRARIEYNHQSRCQKCKD
jgi:putative transposase